MPETPAARDLIATSSINERGEAQESGPPSDKPRRMLNEQQLLELLPFSRATLYRMIANDKFPSGTFVSGHRRWWYEAEIAAWQREVDGRCRGRVNRSGQTADA